MSGRVRWSWAASVEDAEAYRVEARGLIGRHVERIRYFDIDYRTEEFRRHEVGPRTIVREAEWVEPSWRHQVCDSIDYAVELETRDGARFTVSWENLGKMEGLGLRELPAIGNAFRDDADVAEWDVSDTTQWRAARDSAVTSVEMHYERWDDSGESLSCSWVTVELGSRIIEFVLGEGDRVNDRVLPSANNVAVIFDSRFLPPWLADRHG